LKKTTSNKLFLFTSMVILILFFSYSHSISAHSKLEKTYPKNNQILEIVPAKLDIWFQEKVYHHDNSFVLKKDNTDEFALHTVFQEPKDPRHFTIDVSQENLEEGQYTLMIDVYSLDGHSLKETISFSIQKTVVQEKPSSEPLTLVKQFPNDGQIISSVSEIDLWFNQAVEITAIGLFNDQKQSVAISLPTVDPVDPSHITIKLEDSLTKGTYQVTWYGKPLGSTDYRSEKMDVFYFALEEYTPIEKDLVSQMKDAEEKIWLTNIGLQKISYFLVFSSTMILFGGSLLVNLLREYYRKWRVSVYFLTIFVLLGDLLLVLLEVTNLSNILSNQFLSVKFIWLPIIQMVIVLLALLFRRNAWFLYGLAVVMINFLAGHAINPLYGGGIIIFLNSIHIIAASFWIGGILILLLPPSKDFNEWVNKVGPVFSKVAVLSLPVIILSGVLMTYRFVPSFDLQSLWISNWGKVLLVKVALTLLIVIIGYLQRRILKKGLSGLFRRRLAYEGLYGLLIIVFASLLVTSIPSSAEKGITLVQAEKNSVTAHITMTPLLEGLNELTLQFEVDSISSVEVIFEMPPDYAVDYTAFKIDDRTFKVTGNLIHTPGITTMTVKATTSENIELTYVYRVAVPGEI
jgi:copper transport protein